MRKKPRRNGAGWNKGRAQGRKIQFTEDEARALCVWIAEQENWHDLALFSLGFDSFLRSGDLLALQVKDVIYSTGAVRITLAKQQQKTTGAVYPALTPVTRQNLARWIVASGKRSGDFLFTRSKPVDAPPITHKTFVGLVKTWARWLGHPPDDYAAHSLRRTKAVIMYRGGEKVAYLSKLLGHKSEAATLEYLGITQELITQATLRYELATGRGSQNGSRSLKPPTNSKRTSHSVRHNAPNGRAGD